MRRTFSSRRIGRRLGVALLLVVLVPAFSTACFGRFQLTRKVYEFNRDFTTDKWIRWLGFLVLNLVPVYGIAVLVDAVLANSLEFWTGKNPIVAGTDPTRMAVGPNGEVVRATWLSGGAVGLEIVDADRQRHELTLVRESDGVAAYDAAGHALGRVIEVHGQPHFVAAGAR